MPKQFLLNPDGSIPANSNVELLEADGILFVMPAPIPRESGMVAVEQEPQQDSGGVWRQVWRLEPCSLPANDQNIDAFATLTEDQKSALMAILQQTKA